jgi:cysteate synthase
MTPPPNPPPPTRERYRLCCPECGARTADDGLRLTCPAEHGPALLSAEYTSARFATPGRTGLFRYADWLPVVREVPDSPAPVALPAPALGAEIGLTDLWLVFNGYWPERGADLPSCTFKDLEAGAVLGRLPDRPPVLVVASAGNTAAAFAAGCARHDIRCLIVMPDFALPRLAGDGPLPSGVRLVTVDGGDYDDAIALATAVTEGGVGQFEGGIRNVARRDGLGTCLLTAFEATGRLPEVYVQAVGSGAGAVAAHEAALRLRAHGHTTDPLPRMLLGQNAALAPLHDLWRGERRPRDPGVEVLAPELTNGAPPYLPRGGVRDLLRSAGGGLCVADAAATRAAQRLFEWVEGIDIEPAAAVALAGLADAVAAGSVRPDERVLLNVTGGGRQRRAADRPAADPPRPRVRVPAGDVRDPHARQLAAKQVGELLD